MLDVEGSLQSPQEWLVEDLDDRFMPSVVGSNLLNCIGHVRVFLECNLVENLFLIVCGLHILMLFLYLRRPLITLSNRRGRDLRILDFRELDYLKE